ncbi:unnamed protein product [Brassica oleracea]|uniref:(rape) hypothetical protein n=1 Tax=Brassica napus TaxID=3708 RepID=A0A816LVY3_BRANA|nr:unnamed protein product [Brassica napus]
MANMLSQPGASSWRRYLVMDCGKTEQETSEGSNIVFQQLAEC